MLFFLDALVTRTEEEIARSKKSRHTNLDQAPRSLSLGNKVVTDHTKLVHLRSLLGTIHPMNPVSLLTNQPGGH